MNEIFYIGIINLGFKFPLLPLFLNHPLCSITLQFTIRRYFLSSLESGKFLEKYVCGDFFLHLLFIKISASLQNKVDL